MFFAVKAEPARLRACRNDDGFSHKHITGIRRAAERALAEIDAVDDIEKYLRADFRRLLLHFLHQPRALNGFTEAGIIFDIRRDG